MARTIQIDDDIYEVLRENIQDFGESESSVLRRLLGIPAPGGNDSKPAGSSTEQFQAPEQSQSPLQEFLASPRFRLKRNATERFLALLSFAHQQSPSVFDRVLQISGRRRMYFARSQSDIKGSGKSTHPRQIPDTDFWAMTNSDNPQKADILRKALRVLGFADADIRAASRVID